MADDRDETQRPDAPPTPQPRRRRTSAASGAVDGKGASEPGGARSRAARAGADADAGQDRVGRYRIGAVAGATGISAHTLRVWERRYGAFSTSRTEKGTRLYSDADVERARMLSQLQQRGHAIGQIAGLPDPELATLMDAAGLGAAPVPLPATTGELQSLEENFLEAIRRFDLVRAERLLKAAIAGMEPRAVVMQLLPPLFAEIGRRWEMGEFQIAHEHAASALLRDALGELLRTWRPTSKARSVVATTLSGELHEFGALLVSLLASVHGWRSAYLGPNLPAEEILLSVAEVDASAVLVSVVCAQDAKACRTFGDQLRRVRDGLPSHCELVVGGAAAQLLPGRLAGVTFLEDLPTLERWLTASRR